MNTTASQDPNDREEFCLKFGAYKGVPISQIDAAYLQWLSEEPGLWEYVRKELKAELNRRSAPKVQSAAVPNPQVPKPAKDQSSTNLLEELIKAINAVFNKHGLSKDNS